ncbi:MAG: hydroxylamine oxidase [Deltaproteobacteria bacterium]|nr:hydroxylamine oxidase [Deltaproteobacteria bacterium]
MRKLIAVLLAAGLLAAVSVVTAASPKKQTLLSSATQECLSCHRELTPGLVQDWENSRHARMTPREALKKGKLERRVSSEKIPAPLTGTVVGCAECHTQNPAKHKDSYEHNGYQVHTVVTPEDCATCHVQEREQYDQNLMARAYGNLMNNPVYLRLVEDVNASGSFKDKRLQLTKPDAATNADSCLFCHGTIVEVKGLKSRETAQGEMSFPVLTGWPNQGVGRVNPDGSLGSCAACHSRHGFSIEVARKPYTCSKCHKGPDVPAYQVYEVSRHGNLYAAQGKDFDFKDVPWKAGKDFTAPTCAACHVSLITGEGGQVVAERTHRMNDRLPWRLFGLIYAHSHPKSADTSIIRNKAGLPLPTDFSGAEAAPFLIDEKEKAQRYKNLQQVCLSCHSQTWVSGHFQRLEQTIRTTNQMTLAATEVMTAAWDQGLARGLAQKANPFDEAIEKKWIEQWLFFANSTRFASAMMGADYGVFANGRWYLRRNLQEMNEWLWEKGKKR